LQKTGNVAAVMNSMGHSNIKMTMAYQQSEKVCPEAFPVKASDHLPEITISLRRLVHLD